MEAVHNTRVQKMVAVTFEVTRGNMRDIDGRDTVYELTSIPHREFRPAVPEGFLKFRRDRDCDTEEVIN